MQPRVRSRALIFAFLAMFSSQITHPTLAANPVTMNATIQDPDVTATCAVTFDPATNIVSPSVGLEHELPGTVIVHFALFDAARGLISTHDVAIAPPLPGRSPSAPAPFRVDRPFSMASCAVRSAAVAPPKSGSGAAVILGVVAVGGIAALVASSSHGGGLQQAVGTTTTPTPGPTPTSASTFPTATPNPNATPSPSPTPGTGIGLNPNALTFSGSTTTQATVATESGYAGMFSAATGTCGSIATISPATSSAQFTVTATSVGSCSFVVSDTIGHTAQLAVSVASASGTIQTKRRNPPAPAPSRGRS